MLMLSHSFAMIAILSSYLSDSNLRANDEKARKYIVSRPLAFQNFIRRSDCEQSHHRIGAMFSPPAIAAELTSPDCIKLLGERIDKGWVVS